MHLILAISYRLLVLEGGVINFFWQKWWRVKTIDNCRRFSYSFFQWLVIHYCQISSVHSFVMKKYRKNYFITWHWLTSVYKAGIYFSKAKKLFMVRKMLLNFAGNLWKEMPTLTLGEVSSTLSMLWCAVFMRCNVNFDNF